MPRYGDLDALYVKWMHAAPAQKQNFGEIIEKHQTADVVPRSEYDHLKFEFDELDRECDRLEEVEARQDDTIVQAKRDAAREIFEEIERVAISKIDENDPISTLDDTVYIQAIDEVRQKYTEG